LDFHGFYTNKMMNSDIENHEEMRKL